MMLCENAKKILLIQLGDIGDVVWMTPTIWAVKEAYPHAEVSLLVREGNGALLEADPAAGEIFEIRKHRGGLYARLRGQLRFLRDFRRKRFEMVIDFRAGERGAIMAWFSGAPIRVAQYYRDVPFWRNYCFNHPVNASRSEQPELRAAEQSLCIVRELGIETHVTAPRLWVREEVKKRAETLLSEAGIIPNFPWISLNPFSRWSYKEMPYRKWVGIIDWLWEEFHIAAVIVGSEGEREKGAALTGACKGTVYNLAGMTSLAELAGLLSLSRLHIGVDSAAPHIAAAVGTPTVTIYGPSDWRDWAPCGERHRVVVAEGDCVPCYRKGCDGSNISRCLETIPIERIKETLRDVLKQ
jgi:predicted lipopolysaccharide heptosyltransferase III